MSDIERLYRSQRAVDLLRRGYRSPIVVIETNLSSSTVRDMAKTISGGKRASSGPLPSPTYFISSTSVLMEASLFAGIYRVLGTQKIFETIDMDILSRAHALYLELRQAHFNTEKNPLDINKCWVIARDLRSNMAWLRRCEEDGGYYLTVDNQRVASGCPWCQAKRTEKQLESGIKA